MSRNFLIVGFSRGPDRLLSFRACNSGHDRSLDQLCKLINSALSGRRRYPPNLYGKSRSAFVAGISVSRLIALGFRTVSPRSSGVSNDFIALAIYVSPGPPTARQTCRKSRTIFSAGNETPLMFPEKSAIRLLLCNRYVSIKFLE